MMINEPGARAFASLRQLAIGSFFLAALALPVASAEADGVALVAHRAVYDLTLSASTGSSAPSDVRGLIAFDFSGTACEGYAMNFRQRTELQPAEGPVHVADMRSTTFEDGDAKSYRFRTETTDGHGESTLVAGNAQKADDGTVSVTLTDPTSTKISLPAGITFPTQQMELVLAAARAGKSTLAVQLYDGSDNGQKIFNTLSIIGKPIASPPAEKPLQVDTLKDVQRWPVTVSYFDASKDQTTPEYVLSFDLYDNGISSALKLDYGNFALKGDMQELDFLPLSKTACQK